MKSLNIYSVSIIILSVLAACDRGPKVITAQNESSESSFVTGIFDEQETERTSSTNSDFIDDLHQVKVKQTLEASRYVYLLVEEEGSEYWIATSKQPVDLGTTYFYRNRLLKTNFESKEHQRSFDTIYLVNQLVRADHGASRIIPPNNPNAHIISGQKEDIPTHAEKPVQDKGLTKISEIVQNPQDFSGKSVKIKGKCVKINPNIMKRNWIHLQDGSQDDYDLVVTSDTFVKEGQTILIEAMVILNKDFGSGYRYDILLENGKVIETYD